MESASGILSIFQSTPSVGRATRIVVSKPTPTPFQSTPSVGRATTLFVLYFCGVFISIHALRGEGDLQNS